MKQYIHTAFIVFALVAVTAVAQTSYSGASTSSASMTAGGPRTDRDENSRTRADLVRVVEEQEAQVDAQTKEAADLHRRVQRLNELLQSYKLQIEELRLYVFCRTSMRPELCTEPER